jgi:hypothetical protein
MVTRVVELCDKSVTKEILYKQQIVAWSQNKNHVSLSKQDGYKCSKTQSKGSF